MPNTYNFKLSDFFDFVSLSAIEDVDYFIDNTTLYVNNSSNWYNSIDSMVSDSKTLCALDLTKFSNLSSLQTFDPYISSLHLAGYDKFSYLSAGNLKNTSLEISGSNFEILGLYVCPQLSSIDLKGVNHLKNLMLIANDTLSNLYFYPNNFNFDGSLTYSVNMANNIITDESMDSLWTTVSGALTADGSGYNFVNITITNGVTGLSAETVDFIKNKGVVVNLAIP